MLDTDNIFFTIIGSMTPVFACVNILPYPIKRWKKALIAIYGFGVYYLLGDLLGQLITPIDIGGIILLVLLFSIHHRVLNGISALIGYLCAVLLNYFIFIILACFGVTIPKMQKRYPLEFSLVFFFLVFLMTYIIGKFCRKNIRRIEKIKIPKFIIYLLLTQFASCVLIYIFNIIKAERMGYTIKVIQLNGILFFIFFIISFIITFFIVQRYEKEKCVITKLKDLENLQEYTRKIEDMYIEYRVFKHDYFNILSTLKVYIDERDIDGLKYYFETSILPAGEAMNYNNNILGSLSYIKVKEVKGLVYTKLFHAVNEELHITLDIREPIGQFGMDILDITKILGIFLDNAIEAAKASEDKKIYIGFAKREDSVLIVIKNSFLTEIPDLQRIYMLGFSTKGNERGIGLYQARRILSEYENVIHTTEIEEDMFCQKVEIIL